MSDSRAWEYTIDNKQFRREALLSENNMQVSPTLVETPSKILAFPSHKSQYTLPTPPSQKTGYGVNKYIGNSLILVKNSDASQKLIDKTLRIITLLDKETQAYQDLNIPPISVSNPEDDEVLISWAMSPIRIGFTIEGEGDESSWCAVTDGTIDATNAWGYLSDYESEEKLVAFLVSYVIGIYRKYK